MHEPSTVIAFPVRFGLGVGAHGLVLQTRETAVLTGIRSCPEFSFPPLTGSAWDAWVEKLKSRTRA